MTKTKSQEKLIEEARLEGIKDGVKIGFMYMKFQCDHGMKNKKTIKYIVDSYLQSKTENEGRDKCQKKKKLKKRN